MSYISVDIDIDDIVTEIRPDRLRLSLIQSLFDSMSDKDFYQHCIKISENKWRLSIEDENSIIAIANKL